ncbi:MAG: hypothetical protein QOI48_1990 [Solirubrobacteraceae bacterium]|jgi:hypothetical protein|nr:hypothetical protein [Solirubrobacteraceae bacterium]
MVTRTSAPIASNVSVAVRWHGTGRTTWTERFALPTTLDVAVGRRSQSLAQLPTRSCSMLHALIRFAA